MVAIGIVASLFVFFAAASAARLNNEQPIASERDLRRNIFQNYDKLVRPVKNPSTSIPFHVGLAPIQLKEVDEYNQVLVLDGWLKMNWTDDYLQWDTKDYNLTVLRLPASEVWKPDLSLYTAAADNVFFPTAATQVLVYNTGAVLWVPPFTMRSRCPMPYSKKAPKNFLECTMKFGSWTFSENELNLQLSDNKVSMTDFMDIHPDWKMVHVLADRQSKIYPCCAEKYPSINFNVTIRRRSPAFDDNLLQKKMYV